MREGLSLVIMGFILGFLVAVIFVVPPRPDRPVRVIQTRGDTVENHFAGKVTIYQTGKDWRIEAEEWAGVRITSDGTGGPWNE